MRGGYALSYSAVLSVHAMWVTPVRVQLWGTERWSYPFLSLRLYIRESTVGLSTRAVLVHSCSNRRACELPSEISECVRYPPYRLVVALLPSICFGVIPSAPPGVGRLVLEWICLCAREAQLGC